MSFTVIYTISASGIFGAEKIVIKECQLLQKKGFKVMVVGITPIDASPFLDKIRQFGLPYYQIVSKFKFDLGAIVKLKTILKRERCDLVHSNKYKADIISLIASRLAGVPIITTVHGWCSEDLKACVYEKIQAISWRFFDHVICVSGSYKEKVLGAGASEKNVTVIHNGITPENYLGKDIENKRIPFLRRYGIPTNHFIVGIIGRLSVEKGHRYFLEAAGRILKQEPNVSFIIAGEGKEESSIRKLIEHSGLNGHIRMLGYVEKMQEVYTALDAVVMPSLREGLPNVLLEAMLYEKPVIATAVGGIPEVIRNNEDGLLIPPKDSLAIADNLLTLIRNPEERRRIGFNARKRVLEDFTLERKMTKVEELYKEVIQEHRDK